MPDQRAVTGTRLGKGPDARAKIRDQRQHRCPWRRIEIRLAALEVGSLAHQQLSVSGGSDSVPQVHEQALVPNILHEFLA